VEAELSVELQPIGRRSIRLCPRRCQDSDFSFPEQERRRWSDRLPRDPLEPNAPRPADGPPCVRTTRALWLYSRPPRTTASTSRPSCFAPWQTDPQIGAMCACARASSDGAPAFRACGSGAAAFATALSAVR